MSLFKQQKKARLNRLFFEEFDEGVNSKIAATPPASITHYSAWLKGGPEVAGMLQAKPGGSGKQEQ